MNLILGLALVIAVAGVTWLVSYHRTGPLFVEAGEAKDPATIRGPYSRNFALAGVIVGVVAGAAYLLASSQWPDAAPTIFLIAGVALTVLFSVGAAVVRPQAKMGGLAESIALNVVWGVGYGVLLPLLLGTGGPV